MKIENNNGFIRFQLERSDLYFILLRFADRFIDNSKNQKALKKFQETLEPEDFTRVIEILGVHDISIWMEFDEALTFSDDLVEKLFPNSEESHLQLARICVDCHQGYISNKKGHDCVRTHNK